MRGRRKDNLVPVAPGDHEETLAARGRAVVAGSKLAHVDLIAEILKLPMPATECHATACWIRAAIVTQRTPVCELLHVLEHDDPRAALLRPADHGPGEAAHSASPIPFAERFAAAGF